VLSAFRIKAASGIDPEVQRHRLVTAMKRIPEFLVFNRDTSRAPWEDVIECHIAVVKYLCVKSGCRIGYKKSCGFSLCPICVPTRLIADFRRHSDNLPERLTLFVVTPAPTMSDRSQVGSWFKKYWRRLRLTGGLYGVRMRVSRPDVLLVVPAEDVPPRLLADPHAALVASDVSVAEAIDWYCHRYLEELGSWRTPDELLALLADVKGRRRFQGFGKYYVRQRKTDSDTSGQQLFTGEQKKLHKVSGGSAKGGKDKLSCPRCGGKLRAVGVAPSDEGMVWDQTLKCYLWDSGSP